MPAVTASACTASRTRPEHPSTSTPRSASSTTSGPRSAPTTSTADRGHTTPNCPAPYSTRRPTRGTRGWWTASAPAPASSPESYGSPSPANTSTGGPATKRTSSTRRPPSPPSPPAPPARGPWPAGTATDNADPGPPAGYDPTTRRG